MIRVDLDLVGTEIFPQSREIFPVSLRRGSEQVWHPVQDDLKSGSAQQRSRLSRGFHIVSAFVDFQNVVVETLRTHLHFGHAEMTQPFDLVGIDLIWSSFNDQSHVAMRRGLVDGVKFFQYDSIENFPPLWFQSREILRMVHRIETTSDEPLLIIATIRRPCATQNEQLDLVGGMTEICQRPNARFNLCVRIELMFKRAHRAGFIG